MKTIRVGDRGEDVRAWQRVLGVTADGVFGPATEQATKSWQGARGLVADGIVGADTWIASGKDAPASVGAIPFVQAKNFTRASRGAKQITAIVVHTMEAPEGAATAENVAAWFAGDSAPQASAHYNVDPDSIVQSVRDEDIAWHAGPVNDWSIGIEHAGYAKQTAAEWADAKSTAILERSAELAAGLCARWGIPVRRLTAEDLARGERRGFFGHVDVTKGLTGGRGHTDPGEHFPWGLYLANVQAKLDALSTVEIGAADTDPPALATTAEGFVEVEYDGETWLVQPMPSAFCSIGEAVEAAKRTGCELPSPGLVDAIWRAADLRIAPAFQSTDRTAEGMNAPKVYAAVTAAVDAALAGRVPGRDVLLVAGAWKDVAVKNGKVGLYGWHVDGGDSFRGIPLHAPETPGDGRIIQQFYDGHALTWRDYSQSFRLCRRKRAA